MCPTQDLSQCTANATPALVKRVHVRMPYVGRDNDPKLILLSIGRQIVKIRCSSQTQQQGTRSYSPSAAAIGSVAASMTPIVCSPLAAPLMRCEVSQIKPYLAPCDRVVPGHDLTAAAVVPSSSRRYPHVTAARPSTVSWAFTLGLF